MLKKLNIRPRCNAEQIHAELLAQGINSIKGQIGSFLLYKNLLMARAEGKTGLVSSIFEDLGISLKGFGKDSFTCGEFKVFPGSFISRLFKQEYEFEVIAVIDQVL